MQISRAQNQPNFKARVKTINPRATASHLQTSEVAAYKAQKAELKAIGDEHVGFGVIYNPKNLGAFGLLAQQISHKSSETSVKFREGLHLSQLAKVGREMYDEMTRELGSEPVYKKVKKPATQLQQEVNEMME